MPSDKMPTQIAPWPITIDEAARRLHCGVRWLRAHCKKHGLGRRASRAVLFTEAEFQRLYESFPRLGDSGSSVTPPALLPESELQRRVEELRREFARPHEPPHPGNLPRVQSLLSVELARPREAARRGLPGAPTDWPPTLPPMTGKEC